MKSLTREQIMQIPVLRETMTGGEIARELGCSRSTVQKWLKTLKQMDYQVPERKAGRPKTF